MKHLDSINTTSASAHELQQALSYLETGSQRLPIYVTDKDGNPLEYVKLFEETLTDGSKVRTIELHFTTELSKDDLREIARRKNLALAITKGLNTGR